MTPTAIVATGSRSTSGTGPGRGVDLWAFREEGIQLLTSLDLPDPVAVIWSLDGTLLHAVTDTSPVRLITVRVDEDGARAEIARELELTAGGATHLGHGQKEGTLLVVTRDPSTVHTVRLDGEGLPQEVIDMDDAGGFFDGRSPRAVQVVRLPGTDLVAVSDEGLGSVYVMRQDSQGQLDLHSEIVLGGTSAPVAIGADHEAEMVYILDAARGEVAVAHRRIEEGKRGGERMTWTVRSRISTSGREGAARPAYVSMSLRENHVLVVNRGTSTVAALSLALMRPELVAEADVAEGPVDFARWGSRVLVASHEAGTIDVLTWDGHAFTRGEEQFAGVSAPGITYLTVRP